MQKDIVQILRLDEGSVSMAKYRDYMGKVINLNYGLIIVGFELRNCKSPSPLDIGNSSVNQCFLIIYYRSKVMGHFSNY